MRWKKIAVAASAQSRRAFVPEILMPVELDKLKSFIAIFLGILVAGLIVLSVSVGGVKFFSFL